MDRFVQHLECVGLAVHVHRAVVGRVEWVAHVTLTGHDLSQRLAVLLAEDTDHRAKVCVGFVTGQQRVRIGGLIEVPCAVARERTSVHSAWHAERSLTRCVLHPFGQRALLRRERGLRLLCRLRGTRAGELVHVSDLGCHTGFHGRCAIGATADGGR